MDFIRGKYLTEVAPNDTAVIGTEKTTDTAFEIHEWKRYLFIDMEEHGKCFAKLWRSKAEAEFKIRQAEIIYSRVEALAPEAKRKSDQKKEMIADLNKKVEHMDEEWNSFRMFAEEFVDLQARDGKKNAHAKQVRELARKHKNLGVDLLNKEIKYQTAMRAVHNVTTEKQFLLLVTKIIRQQIDTCEVQSDSMKTLYADQQAKLSTSVTEVGNLHANIFAELRAYIETRHAELEDEVAEKSKTDKPQAEAITKSDHKLKFERMKAKLKELEKRRIEKSKKLLQMREDQKSSQNVEAIKKEIELKEQEIAKLESRESEIVDEQSDKSDVDNDDVKVLAQLKAAQNRLNTQIELERRERRKVQSDIEDAKGQIRVFCRVRPMSSSELARKNVSAVSFKEDNTIIVQHDRTPRVFTFSRVYQPEDPQEKVFSDTKNLINCALEGYNVCIFAYGQTGSGKTHTMIGTEELPGIARRAFFTIFDHINDPVAQVRFSYAVEVYMLELYNDKLQDLFSKSKSDQRLEPKKTPEGIVEIPGSEKKKVTTERQLLALFEDACKNRHTASTQMNQTSSRSHLIFGIVLRATGLITGKVTTGKLSLIDLAGSERVGKTGATDERLEEAKSINKSLSALGDVISQLTCKSGSSHISYRNNLLTKLMEDSLGGNAKTCMFVNVSPADYNSSETTNSLNYAQRAKNIKCSGPKVNEQQEIRRLQSILEDLKNDVAVKEIY